MQSQEFWCPFLPIPNKCEFVGDARQFNHVVVRTIRDELKSIDVRYELGDGIYLSNVEQNGVDVSSDEVL